MKLAVAFFVLSFLGNAQMPVPGGSGSTSDLSSYAQTEGIQRRTYTGVTLTSSGTDAYAGTVPGLATNYIGVCVFFKPDVANIGAASINLNSIGAEPIKSDADADPADSTVKANIDTQFCWNTSLDSGMGAWGIVGGGSVVNNTTIQNITEVTQEVLFSQLNVTQGSIRVSNQSPTGTEVNHLASLTGAPSTAIETSMAATSGVIGVVTSGAGTTGQARITIFGDAICDFTNGTTAGNYVQVSTTVDGECEDVGSSPPTTGGIVLGRVKETGAAGNRTMLVNIQNIPASGVLEEQSAADSATLDFTTCFSSGHDAYRITVLGLRPATDNQVVNMRFSTDGGMTYVAGTSYAWVGSRASVGGSANNVGSNGTDSFGISVSGTQDNATGVGVFDATIDVYHPTAGGNYPGIYVYGGSWDGTANSTVGMQMRGVFKSTNPVTGFRVLMGSGLIAEGTVQCSAL